MFLFIALIGMYAHAVEWRAAVVNLNGVETRYKIKDAKTRLTVEKDFPFQCEISAPRIQAESISRQIQCTDGATMISSGVNFNKEKDSFIGANLHLHVRGSPDKYYLILLTGHKSIGD